MYITPSSSVVKGYRRESTLVGQISNHLGDFYLFFMVRSAVTDSGAPCKSSLHNSSGHVSEDERQLSLPSPENDIPTTPLVVLFLQVYQELPDIHGKKGLCMYVEDVYVALFIKF